MADRVFDSSGRELWLDATIGRGGEGVVHGLLGVPQNVVKLYGARLSPGKVEKLRAMTRLSTQELRDVAAWPVDVVLGSPGGPVIGVLMQRITGYREIHRLYSPAHRKVEFPRADWAFLLRVARNLAAAFDTVHAHGHVVGDVNQGNVLVSGEGLVRFIDCDSFQVCAGERVYPCDVGVAHFTPPELQGGSFTQLVRTRDHDLFGLAVLTFHLLFMGRHPFAGRPEGNEEIPIEKAIAELRFAFSADASSRALAPPPHSLALTQVPASLARLFERAFSVGSARGEPRPGAQEWMRALDIAERWLGRCLFHPGHAYFFGAPECPWCRIRLAGGPDFFATLAASMDRGPVDAQEIWQRILEIPRPPRALSTRDLSVACYVPEPPLFAGMQRLLEGPHALVWALGLILILVWPSSSWLAGVLVVLVGIVRILQVLDTKCSREHESATEGMKDAEQEIRAREETCREEVDELFGLFEAKRTMLEGLKNELEQTISWIEEQPEEQGRSGGGRSDDRAGRPLVSGNPGSVARDRSLQAYLSRQFIDRAGLPGIGFGLRATLAAYGIETAADVSSGKLDAVPGLGSIRGRTLLRWRRSLERSFDSESETKRARLDPSQTRERSIPKRERLERGLAQGLEDLGRLSRISRDLTDGLSSSRFRWEVESARLGGVSHRLDRVRTARAASVGLGLLLFFVATTVFRGPSGRGTGSLPEVSLSQEGQKEIRN